MYLISGNITSNVTGNLLVITGNANIGNITSNFRTLVLSQQAGLASFVLECICVISMLLNIGKSSESVQCAMLKACDTCTDMGQL